MGTAGSLASVLVVVSLWAGSVACGSSADTEDGAADIGSGGTGASGGAGTGTGGATGGTGTGGATGGTGTGTGGTGSGGTGSVGDEGWEEIRCLRHNLGAMLCYGRLGNLWTLVSPVCTYTEEATRPIDMNSEYCGGADSSEGWDEAWCDETQCFVQLGDWLTTVLVECLLDETPIAETPAELYCDEMEAPTGWDDLQCFSAACFGRQGLYYPNWGLYPQCYLDEPRPEYTEISVDEALAVYCP